MPRFELQELARLQRSTPREREERLQRTQLHAQRNRLGTAPIDRLNAQYELAERLAAARPEGCICLGAGDTDTGKICEACPEGLAIRAEQDERERARRVRDVASFIERAGIPSWFTDFTLDSHPGAQAAMSVVRSHLANDTGYNFFLWGNYGTGKTGMAVGILKNRVEAYCEAAFFVTVPRLLEMIRASYDKHDSPHEEALRRARTTSLLVLDDLGAERPTDWVQEQLYLIINERHDNRLDTVITSNLTLDQLADRIGERTIWRIAEMCKVIEVKGKNLRDRR